MWIILEEKRGTARQLEKTKWKKFGTDRIPMDVGLIKN